SDVILNLGAFDFHHFAKEQLNWFSGKENLLNSKIPIITSAEANFDIFTAKLLRLLRNYATELKQYFPTASIVAKFYLLKEKYQELKLKQRQNEYIGEHAKTLSFRWPSVLGMIKEKWSQQIDSKDPNRPLKKPETSEKTRLRNLQRASRK
ncbi:hypothetical protein TYRP_008721, partial [Tyrophagus putrescentiae]